jgi:hypothetical protein
MSCSVVLSDNEKRTEQCASSSLRPIAINTCVGSGELRQFETCSRVVREHVVPFGRIRRSSAAARRMADRLCSRFFGDLDPKPSQFAETSLWLL